MGLAITSNKTKVFRNERDGRVYFTTSISRKTQDGKYEYMNKLVKFQNGQEPTETTDIVIDSAFLSFYKKQDGTNQDYIMVMTYHTESEEKVESFKKDEIVLTDDDLPF